MKKYDYILWDLDGTLVNTYEGVSRSLSQSFEYYDVHMDCEDYYPFIGPPLRYSLPICTDVPDELVEDVIERFRRRYNTIGVFECELFPGVKETLEALRCAGYIQVIASSKPEERCMDILNKFGIADLLDGVVGASMDGRIDSKIEVLDETFSRMRAAYPDFTLERTVLIGDTRYDAEGARQAGIDCVGISYGYGSREELMERGVETIYDDLGSLTEEFLREAGDSPRE